MMEMMGAADCGCLGGWLYDCGLGRDAGWGETEVFMDVSSRRLGWMMALLMLQLQLWHRLL